MWCRCSGQPKNNTVIFYWILTIYSQMGSSWPWSYMVVGFTTILMQSVHITTDVSSNLDQGECTLCDNVCQWLATNRWFSPGPPVSSTNKTDHHDIAELLLKVALNTIKPTNEPSSDADDLPVSDLFLSIRLFRFFVVVSSL
jgi:hypothetical protein